LSPKAYLLLDIKDGKSEDVIRFLRGKEGVSQADMLEGPPDVVVVCEAANKSELAEVIMRTFAVIEPVTEGMHLLPVQNGTGSALKRVAVKHGKY